MRKTRVSAEIVRLNGAAFRLAPEAIRTGNLEALVDEALLRIAGCTLDASCIQYNCNMYAPSPPPA